MFESISIQDMKQWIIKQWKRFWFYRTELGKKILSNYKYLCGSNLSYYSYNYSCDPKYYISFREIQWSISHRLYIEEDKQDNYWFLNYVRYPYYINNPDVRAD